MDENNTTTKPPLVLFQRINPGHSHSFTSISTRHQFSVSPIIDKKVKSKIILPKFTYSIEGGGGLKREQEQKWLELSKDT